MILKGKNMKKLLFLSVPLMLMGTIAFTNKGFDVKQANFDAEKPTLREVNRRPNDYIAREPVGADVITMSGNGTESNPYIIKTASHFAQMQYDLYAYYKLNNDINFNNAEISPIPGTFQGHFDGNLKTLSKFKISKNYTTNTSGAEYLGLFNTIGSYGEIYNFTIKESTIDVKQAANNNTLVYGGLVCGMNYGEITGVDCYKSNVKIETKFGLAGGIAGYSNGLIRNIQMHGCKVFGCDVVGGIVGRVDASSTTSSCFLFEERGFWPWEVTESQVKLIVKNVVNSFCAGGIVGYCYGQAIIEYSNIYDTKYIVSGTLNRSPVMGYIAGHMNGGNLFYNPNFLDRNSKTNINSSYTTYYFANYDGMVGKCENYPYVVDTRNW